jgi:hypothetical protein
VQLSRGPNVIKHPRNRHEQPEDVLAPMVSTNGTVEDNILGQQLGQGSAIPRSQRFQQRDLLAFGGLFTP